MSTAEYNRQDFYLNLIQHGWYSLFKKTFWCYHSLKDSTQTNTCNIVLSCIQTYMPRTRSSFGVGGLPSGAEYYKACLKWQLSTDVTADEVHQQGLREVNRVYIEIQKVN